MTPTQEKLKCVAYQANSRAHQQAPPADSLTRSPSDPDARENQPASPVLENPESLLQPGADDSRDSHSSEQESDSSESRPQNQTAATETLVAPKQGTDVISEEHELPAGTTVPHQEEPAPPQISPAIPEGPPLPNQPQGLDEELVALKSVFIEYQRRNEQRLDALAGKFEESKRGTLLEFVRPALQPLVNLHAELLKSAKDIVDDHARAQDLEYFADSIERALDLLDIVSVDAREEAPFDRREHFAVLTKPTDNPAQDQKIARVIRQGFRLAGHERVLIPARVSVWKYTAPMVAAESTRVEHNVENDGGNDLPNTQQ